MEEEYRLHFVPCLHLGEIEDCLQRECGKEKEIIARETEKRDMIGSEKKDEKGAGENAGSCFFQAENDEFPDMFVEPTTGHMRRGRESVTDNPAAVAAWFPLPLLAPKRTRMGPAPPFESLTKSVPHSSPLRKIFTELIFVRGRCPEL